jgi:hypothetical protein
MKTYLVYLWSFGWDALVWLLILLCRAAWGRGLRWNRGLWCIVKSGSWLARVPMRGAHGVTLGHGGLILEGHEGGPGIDTEIEYHENDHVEQYEVVELFAAVAAGASLAAGANWILCLAMWLVAWPLFYALSVFVAWLRGEDPYRGSCLEEGTYARSDAWRRRRFR